MKIVPGEATMCENFSNIFQAKMHLMSECWRHAWSSRLPQKSKNPSFQTESLDSGQKDGFLDFPRFFWILRKGVWIFWVSKSKIQKNLRKKMDFCKNPTFTCIFLDFLEKSIFFLEFFGFLISGLEKSIFFLGFFFLDFCKNPSFSKVFLHFSFQDWKNQSFS